MISRASQWTQTPSATSLQPKNWYAHFKIMFNFCWLAGLVDGLKPHLPPLSSQKYEILIFGLCSTSDDLLSNPSNKCWLKCEKRPPKSSKNEMIVFGLHSISDDRLSNLSNECRPKCEKRPPKSLKNEMLIFGLHSISDDRPSNLSDKRWLKCKKRPAKSSKNEMFIFWWSTRRLSEDHQKTSGSLLVVFVHYDTRKFLWKITLLHGQLCHKPYGFLV